MNNPQEFQFFQAKKCKKINYDFKGGDLSSEGGLLLLREFDDKLGFSQGISDCIPRSDIPPLNKPFIGRKRIKCLSPFG